MGYCLQDIVSWYQKKIGTYDKQPWERTVEQHILSGFTPVPKKTAKLKTELIDIDLIRGSSFTKAKPKHGFLTVIRLAVLRLLFLPLQSAWWAQQTSYIVFGALLLLYILQIVNMILYFYFSPHQTDGDEIEQLSVSEVLVPLAMMFGLSLLHSQIVSPYSCVNQCTSSRKTRRAKRSKRRPAPSTRYRSNIGSDSKSSPDTGSELTANQGSKCRKRVRLRNVSPEDSLFNHARKAPTMTVEVKEPYCEELRFICTPPPVSDRESASGEVSSSRPSQVDDGFESLNGNGSSDNNEEEGNKSHGSDGDTGRAAAPAPAGDPGETQGEGVLHGSHIPTSSPFSSDPNTSGGIGEADETDQKDTDSEPSRPRTSVCSQKLLNRRRGSLQALNMKLAESSYCTSGKSDGETVSNPSTTILDRLLLQKLLNRRRGSLQALNMKLAESSYCTSGKSDGEIVSNPSTTILDPLNMKLAESSYCTSGESDGETKLLNRRRGSLQALNMKLAESSYCTSGESDGETVPDLTTSAAEWIGITTNSEECSYSSDMDQVQTTNNSELTDHHPFAWEFQISPAAILSPSCASSDKVSCTMWDKREVKKAELSVLDISSAIIARVEGMPENLDYFYGGLFAAVLLAAVPSLCRLSTSLGDVTVGGTPLNVSSLFSVQSLSDSLDAIIVSAFGASQWERTIILIGMLERCILGALFFFLLAVAERTFKQRFLYAKFFSHLTSFRRARKSELPHFRLNKVRNIKTWLSVRSYLKKRGPQRSVDIVVSAAFIITLLLLSFLSVELLKDSVHLRSTYNVEALAWTLVLGVFLLRFMTLGTKINRKYRNLSVLITEQINLYLQIEQKPNKKEELMVANSVLKLAADLLKELESPFKISGLSANPYLYTITKVVILSALSGVLSEMLGFKLKLHKIKIK
ncbi:LOW QUALITY PROTEIN: protein phtf [Homalodisca vitripennis]|nr:LOW QUALITY PROTEIN: protein phtf [Homalodisca vitripennis]